MSLNNASSIQSTPEYTIETRNGDTIIEFARSGETQGDIWISFSLKKFLEGWGMKGCCKYINGKQHSDPAKVLQKEQNFV